MRADVTYLKFVIHVCYAADRANLITYLHMVHSSLLPTVLSVSKRNACSLSSCLREIATMSLTT